MKNIIMVVSILFYGMVFSAPNDEVGNGVIVMEPKATPIFTSDDAKKKVWICEGLVNEKLVDAIFNDISSLSYIWGLPKPNRSICLYSQTQSSFGGGMRLDSISFSTQVNYPTQCELSRSCLTNISVRLMSIKGENYRSYTAMKTENNEQKFYGSCSKLNGTVLSVSKACMELGL